MNYLDASARTRRQIFVAGTWNREKSAPFASVSFELGKLIGAGGYDLSCGPGTGTAGHVVDGFRSIDSVGDVRFYLPEASLMEAVGERVERTPDDLVQTALDYPMRNVYQIRQSDALIVVTGGDGALEEILPALVDYSLPTALLEGSGRAVEAIRVLADGFFPDWHSQLLFGRSAGEIYSWVHEELSSR